MQLACTNIFRKATGQKNVTWKYLFSDTEFSFQTIEFQTVKSEKLVDLY